VHIAIFVEKRNGVDLACRIMAAPGAPERHRFCIVTADIVGEVARWITDEAATRLGDGVAVRNLFALGEGLGDDAFEQELKARITRFVTDEGVDRLVLFNDQSRRGRRVMEGVDEGLPRLPVVLVQDGHLDFHYKTLTAGRRDRNWYYGASLPAAVCVWGPAMAQHIAFRAANRPSPAVHVTGALGHSDDPQLLRAARSAGHRRGRRPGEPLRVLVLDQLLGDQGKLERDTHRALLADIRATLAAHGEVEIKPHPPAGRVT
jgi:hypothetical protein